MACHVVQDGVAGGMRIQPSERRLERVERSENVRLQQCIVPSGRSRTPAAGRTGARGAFSAWLRMRVSGEMCLLHGRTRR